MSWADPIGDLRVLISDGLLDKYSYRKKIFGQVDGNNRSFKTLETRRTQSFANALTLAPVGVYLNDVIIPTTRMSSDDVVTGEFTIGPAVTPQPNDTITASYYYQWFFDTEIQVFLRQATQWAISSSDYTNLTDGLQPCVLHYSAGLAYMKLSLWFSRHLAEQYRVEDMPDEVRLKIAGEYGAAADQELLKIAPELRAQFYERNDQYLQPLSTTVKGHVRAAQPKR